MEMEFLFKKIYKKKREREKEKEGKTRRVKQNKQTQTQLNKYRPKKYIYIDLIYTCPQHKIYRTRIG